MAHPYKAEVADTRTEKLHKLTLHYGRASGLVDNVKSSDPPLEGELGSKSDNRKSSTKPKDK